MCLHPTLIIACKSNNDDCNRGRSGQRSSSGGHWRWWRYCLAFLLTWMTGVVVGLLACHVKLPRQLEKGGRKFLYLTVNTHHLY